jgi:hypothetical protein
MGSDAIRVTDQIADISGLTSALAAKQATSEKNQANGYPGLDSSGDLVGTFIPRFGTAAHLRVRSCRRLNQRRRAIVYYNGSSWSLVGSVQTPDADLNASFVAVLTTTITVASSRYLRLSVTTSDDSEPQRSAGDVRLQRVVE